MAIFKPGKRELIEKHILKRMKEIDPSGYNHKIWKQILTEISDEKLNEVISGEGIPLYTELGGEFDASLDHIRSVLEDKMGVQTYQRVYLTNPKTGILTRTRLPHMIGRVPVRTQTQTYEKKSSVPIHNRLIDSITHQVTSSGVSRASSISQPETSLMVSEGYLESSKEFVNARGGNQDLQRAIHAEIINTGEGSLNQPHLVGTKAKAPKVWGRIYKAMHIGTNMDT